jgi:CHASE3 domain sensor protein
MKDNVSSINPDGYSDSSAKTPNSTHVHTASSSMPLIAGLLALGLVGVGGYTAYQGSQIDGLRRQVTAAQQDNAALRTNLSATDGELQKTLEGLRGDLVTNREETISRLQKAQVAARRHADTVAGKIQKAQQEQQQHAEQVAADLSKKIQDSADETSTKFSDVNSNVGAVKTEVETAKQSIEQTLGDLQRVRGDMGVMSGLIATNGKEIQMLRELGDRNIYEFTLAKKAGEQKVGDIQVKLKKADPKRNRYTMEVLADDKLVEKKDKGANEPVQFYVLSKARQPYEIVVNDVSKDTVKGYLSTPKTTVSRSAGQ